MQVRILSQALRRAKPDPKAQDRLLTPDMAPLAYAVAAEYGLKAGVEFDLYVRPQAGSSGWALHAESPPRVVLGAGLVYFSSERELRWTLAHEIGHLTRPPRRRLRRALYLLWRSLAVFVVADYGLLLAKVIGPALYFGLLSLLPLVAIAFPLAALWLERREERRADAFAKAMTGHGPEPHYFGDSPLWEKAQHRPYLRPLARALSTHPPGAERVQAGLAKAG